MTTPDPTEIACCPFCGGKAVPCHIRDGRQVKCTQCLASGPGEYHGPADGASATERAIAAWNRRAAVPPEAPTCRAEQKGPREWVCDCAAPGPACAPFVVPPEAPEAGEPGQAGKNTFATVLLSAASKSRDPGAITLAAQLAGVAPCPDCGFRKEFCRCAAPAAPRLEPTNKPRVQRIMNLARQFRTALSDDYDDAYKALQEAVYSELAHLAVPPLQHRELSDEQINALARAAGLPMSWLDNGKASAWPELQLFARAVLAVEPIPNTENATQDHLAAPVDSAASVVESDDGGPEQFERQRPFRAIVEAWMRETFGGVEADNFTKSEFSSFVRLAETAAKSVVMADRDAAGVPALPVELGPDAKEWAKTEAGYTHVDTMMARKDGEHLAPFWYGWALREAFVAGAEWQERRTAAGVKGPDHG